MIVKLESWGVVKFTKGKIENLYLHGRKIKSQVVTAPSSILISDRWFYHDRFKMKFQTIEEKIYGIVCYSETLLCLKISRFINSCIMFEGTLISKFNTALELTKTMI